MSLQCRTIVRAVAFGSSLFAATPAQAETPVALLTQSPVALTACHLDYRLGTPGPYSPATSWVDGLEVQFHNQRRLAADEVDLQVRYNGQETTIVDKGTFATSTTIAHVFGMFDNSVYVGSTPDQCSIVAVRYSDGSAWNANDNAPAPHVANTR